MLYLTNITITYFTLENASTSISSNVFVLKYAQDATIAALSVQYFILGKDNSILFSWHNFSSLSRIPLFAATPPATIKLFI